MKKPIGIVLTDTHLNKDSLEDNISIFSQVIKKAQELELNKVYHLGDIFTNRAAQTLQMLITFLKVLDMFEKAQIGLIVIPGNHDKVDLNSDASYLDIFKSDWFKVINKPHVIFNTNDSGFNFCFLPYYKEVDLYPEKLSSLLTILKGQKNKNILLTHIAINGVQNNDGSVVDNDIGENLFLKFYKVFTGHYHNRSQIGKSIFYIGSAFPQNFGEDSEKGFTIIYSDGSHDYFKPEFKEYIKLEVSLDQVNDFIKQEAYTKLVEAGNKVRFVINGEETAIKSFDRSRVTELGISVQLKNDKIEENIKEIETRDFVSFNHDSVSKAYETFCIENNFDQKLGIEYLTKVKN